MGKTIEVLLKPDDPIFSEGVTFFSMPKKKQTSKVINFKFRPKSYSSKDNMVTTIVRFKIPNTKKEYASITTNKVKERTIYQLYILEDHDDLWGFSTTKFLSLGELINRIKDTILGSSIYYSTLESMILETIEDTKETPKSSGVVSKYYPELGKYFLQEAIEHRDLIKADEKSQREIEKKESLEYLKKEKLDKKLREKYRKLDGNKLLISIRKWYSDGAKTINAENAFHNHNEDYLSNILAGRGKYVINLLKESNLKEKTKILNKIVKIAKRPLDPRRAGLFGNMSVGAYNEWLNTIKSEIL